MAYLHDTVEDSTATIEEIQEMFGVDVADAGDGATTPLSAGPAW